MVMKIDSSGYHTHQHEHNRASDSPALQPNSQTDHHSPFSAYGGRSGPYNHLHPHNHLHDPDRQNNLDSMDDPNDPVNKYEFDEEWFRNPLDSAENDVGYSGENGVDLV